MPQPESSADTLEEATRITAEIEKLACELFEAGDAVTCEYKSGVYAGGWEKVHPADKIGFRHMARMVRLKIECAREEGERIGYEKAQADEACVSVETWRSWATKEKT